MTEQERRLELGRVVEGMILSKWGSLSEGMTHVGMGRTTLHNFIRGNPNASKRKLRSMEFGLDLPQFSFDYVIAGDHKALAALSTDERFTPDTKRVLLEIVQPSSRKGAYRQTAT